LGHQKEALSFCFNAIKGADKPFNFIKELGKMNWQRGRYNREMKRECFERKRTLLRRKVWPSEGRAYLKMREDTGRGARMASR